MTPPQAATALESIEDDFQQAPTRRGRFGFGISPQFERAKAAREPRLQAVKPVAAAPAETAAAPERLTCTITLPPMIELDCSAVEVKSYDQLHKALRERCNELNISRATVDHITGLTGGLSSKILGIGQTKRLGMESLGLMLDALGVKLLLVPDHAALKRNRHRYVQRDEPHTKSVTRRWSKLPRRITGTCTARFAAWPAAAE